MQSTSISFDPAVHITAGQLRDIGFLLNEMIPDDAFVRRVSISLNDNEDFNDGSATLGLCTLEAFVTPVLLECCV